MQNKNGESPSWSVHNRSAIWCVHDYNILWKLLYIRGARKIGQNLFVEAPIRRSLCPIATTPQGRSVLNRPMYKQSTVAICDLL